MVVVMETGGEEKGFELLLTCNLSTSMQWRASEDAAPVAYSSSPGRFGSGFGVKLARRLALLVRLAYAAAFERISSSVSNASADSASFASLKTVMVLAAAEEDTTTAGAGAETPSCSPSVLAESAVSLRPPVGLTTEGMRGP